MDLLSTGEQGFESQNEAEKMRKDGKLEPVDAVMEARARASSQFSLNMFNALAANNYQLDNGIESGRDDMKSDFFDGASGIGNVPSHRFMTNRAMSFN